MDILRLPKAEDRRVKQILERWEKAKAARANYDSLWDDIAETMFPGRIGFTRTLAEGEQRTGHLVNSAAARASKRLGTILQGSVTPRDQSWIDVQASDRDLNEQRDVREWFEIVNEVIWNTIYNPRTGWERSSGEVYRDLGTFGGAAIFNATRPTDGSMLFSAIPLKDVWIEANAFQELSTFYVQREYMIYQVMQMFGTDQRLSLDTRRKIQDGKLTDKIKLLHYVTERHDRDPNKRDRLNKPWLSIWIEVDAKHLIEEGGFDFKPYIYPRLETVVGELYPWSPGRLALPDSLMLQAQQRSVLTSAHFQTQPPLMVPDNGFFDVDQYAPGEFLHYDATLLEQMKAGQFPVQPLNTGHNAGIAQDMVDATKQDIWQAFMLDLVTLPDRANMTATEILQRNREFTQQVAPPLAQVADEYPAHIVDSVFQRQLNESAAVGFDLSAGSHYPTPPQALEGQETKVNVKAPIQELQAKVELSGSISQMREALEPLLGIDPDSVISQINVKEIARDTIRVFGKADYLMGEDEAEEALAARQEAAQRQQQLAEGGAEADIMNKIGQADRNLAAAENVA